MGIIENSLHQAETALHEFISDPQTPVLMEKAVAIFKQALDKGCKIISCGNGGSLCDAAHFARWVEAFGREGDVLLAISTSGNSGNVVMAIEKAKACGMKVVALTAKGGNKLSELADVAICAPRTPHSDRIQEIHIKVIHILIEALEDAIFYASDAKR